MRYISGNFVWFSVVVRNAATRTADSTASSAARCCSFISDFFSLFLFFLSSCGSCMAAVLLIRACYFYDCCYDYSLKYTINRIVVCMFILWYTRCRVHLSEANFPLLFIVMIKRSSWPQPNKLLFSFCLSFFAHMRIVYFQANFIVVVELVIFRSVKSTLAPSHV